MMEAEIGGAFVRRPFTRGGELLKAGTTMTGDEVRAINIANRRALIDAAYLEVWPKPPVEQCGDRVVVHIGGGKYDVYSGRINEVPLSREEAEDLATQP